VSPHIKSTEGGLGGVGAHSTDTQVLEVIIKNTGNLLSLAEYARKQIKKGDKNSLS